MVKFFFLWSHFDFYDTKPNFAVSYVLVSIYEDTVKDYRYHRSLNAEALFKYIYGDHWQDMIKHQYPRDTAVLQFSSMQIDEILNLY